MASSTWHTYAIIKWRFQKILSNFNSKLVMNFGRFGKTTVDDQSLWNSAWETLRLDDQMVFCGQTCTITPSCALRACMMIKGILLHGWLEPQIWVFEWTFLKFQTKKAAGLDEIKTSFDVWLLCTLCQIWGHLNNARWINGPQVVS